MEQCFHKKCDIPSTYPDLEGSFMFLSRTTQALVLAIFELTMPEKTSLPEECGVILPENEIRNEVENTEKNERIQDSENIQKQFKYYQPNYGTQINIENFYANNVEFSPTPKLNDDLLMLLSQKNSLARVIQNYYGNEEREKVEKKREKKNSPMIIKMLQKREL